MTTTAPVLAAKRFPMDSARKTAFVAGIFYLITFVASIPAVLLLGTLMYRSGPVPRIIPTIGLIGAPVLLSSTIATMFGINDKVSV
jgi:hypothetical protein